jgi:hypothetical protein
LPSSVKRGEPLVADAAADAVAFTELGQRDVVAEGVGHELQSLVHGVTEEFRQRYLEDPDVLLWPTDDQSISPAD